MLSVRLLLTCVAVGVTSAVRVETQYGVIQGQTLTLNDGRHINSFLGVPFAKPPTGELRWKAPEDPEPWTTPFKADRIRSACEQSRVGIIYLTHLFWDDFSEDCLHLNIYTPQDMSKGPYPVLVFYHGGGFSAGANFQYPGYFLASRDVIVVVPNYRLGALGFVSTGDSAARGNYGLMDQQKALKFVRDNIKNFGGDPNRITISGQSAGGASVGLQTLSPLAKGLFQQAILQSGTDQNNWAFQGPEQKPWTYTEQLAQSVSCPTADHSTMITCLRDKPAQQFTGFQPNCTAGFVCLGFGPVVDGYVLPEHPLVLRNRSDFHKVPMLNGITQNDGSLVAAIMHEDMLEDGVTQAQFEEVLRDTLGYALTGHPDVYKNVYRAVKFYYTPWGQQWNKSSNRQALREYATDFGFGYPWDLVSKSACTHSDTYSYVFDYRTQPVSDLLPEWLGVFHALEIPYVFGFPFIFQNSEVADESKFTHEIIAYNKEDDKMADFVMDLWTNFVKTGNPTPTPTPTPTGGLLTWSKFELSSKQTVVIDTKPRHVSRYKQRDYALLTQYAMYFINKQ